MWRLYDDLYIGIPSGITIDSCIIGEKWVTVRSNGNVGIARLIEPATHAGAEFTGKYLRDTGCHLWWDNLTKAAAGVAALNAWYNTPERAEGLASSAYCYEDVTGKIAAVGECPLLSKSGKKVEAFELPMCPEAVTEEAYGALKKYDCVVISGDAITTRSAEALIELIGEEGYVIMDGASVPMSPSFFAFDMPVKRINGYYRRFDNTMENAARLGIADIEPGTISFSVVPVAPEYVHERKNVENFKNSPYRASKFNQRRFADWQGKEYDYTTWDEQFRG
ncbi:MAG: Rossmann-like domain-containing protein [Lachnospiraceae bacterium]|jgi:hypothetical protein